MNNVKRETATPQLPDGEDTTEEQRKLLHDAVRALPSAAVKDLLSLGVCVRCVFRVLGGGGFLGLHLSPPAFLSAIEEPSGPVDDGSGAGAAPQDAGAEICRVCLGVLQFVYRDEGGALVKMRGPVEFAASIAEMAKREGHCVDRFSLELCLPQIISENEQSIRSYVKSKYQSEPWFEEVVRESMLVKDVFKCMTTTSLEKLLVCETPQLNAASALQDVKSGPGSFCVRLTYNHVKPSSAVSVSDRNGSFKRLKTDEANVTRKDSKGNGSSQDCNFLAEKVTEPCHLVIACYRTPVCFVGRYFKFSRNVSQTRWIIDDERMGEASVEEVIGANILPICRGDAYKFHAAGREDIDVRMLGSGRPFLVEIQNPHQLPTNDAVKEVESKLNNLENKLVGVKNLQVAIEGWTMMREGEAEKQKEYCALVWISRPLKDEDLQSIASFKDMNISQKTPIRVLHRRSPLERERTIHWMKIEAVAGSSQHFLLHLCTQAGTYVKEFVHGDLGRTHPSLGSILGCRAEILQLDVTDVKMDCCV